MRSIPGIATRRRMVHTGNKRERAEYQVATVDNRGFIYIFNGRNGSIRRLEGADQLQDDWEPFQPKPEMKRKIRVDQREIKVPVLLTGNPVKKAGRKRIHPEKDPLDARPVGRPRRLRRTDKCLFYPGGQILSKCYFHVTGAPKKFPCGPSKYESPGPVKVELVAGPAGQSVCMSCGEPSPVKIAIGVEGWQCGKCYGDK